MARDYAKKTSRRSQASTGRKRAPEPALGAPAWAWAIVGLALGLFVAFLVYLNEHRPAPAAARAGAGAERQGPAERPAGAPRTRFDFYTILPELEVVLPERPVEEERPGRAEEPKASYLLQAGSFRALEQADSMRARLALLGVESTIETVRIKDDEIWHRVRVGPFDNLREVARIQERLRRQEIQTLRVQVKG